MKKHFFLFLMAAVSVLTLNAHPVSSPAARQAAQKFLTQNESRLSFESLSLTDSWTSANGDTLMFVFNIDDKGFIIVNANDALPPVAGYSLNGSYDRSRLPDNFKGWLENLAGDIEGLLGCVVLPTDIAEEQKGWLNEWKQLLNPNSQAPSPKSTKSVQPLIESHWSQGYGYNDYCPAYEDGTNGHCVVGCVATAMSQIIRYHGYPNTGFFHRGYAHPAYGYLFVDFDSAYYDYSQMPNELNYYSSEQQRHAVALLCYHCGVSVKMIYEYDQHPSGSGAHSENVPQALMHFGYTNTTFLTKSGHTTAQWDSILRHDLDLSLPVYYSGSGDQGGHAFICDGYTNNGYYHFNFGWGGYTDGNYLLTSLNGFTNSQDAVVGIVPSGLAANLETTYIAPDGTGDGSSWNSPSSNLLSAIKLRGLYKNGKFWLKSGTYYGDTTGNSAFKISSGLKFYGGFNGSETALDQRDANTAPTILSANGRNRVVEASSLSSAALMNTITISDGYFNGNGAGIYMEQNMTLEYCTIQNCRSDSSTIAALYNSGGTVNGCIVHNNNCNGMDVGSGKASCCLIAHNNGRYAVDIYNADLFNCDVVSNRGTGVVNRKSTIRNCIIWNNDSSLSVNENTTILFSAIEGFDTIGDTNSNISLLHENRPLEGYGPFFMLPDTTRGVSSVLGDWQLSSLSPLVDAGDTLRRGIYTKDLNGNNRFRGGRVDMGCYEHDPYVGICHPTAAPQISIYPNPANSLLHIEGPDGTATVYDIQGRRVLSTTIVDGHSLIDISDLPKGLYLLHVSNASRKFMKR